MEDQAHSLAQNLPKAFSQIETSVCQGAKVVFDASQKAANALFAQAEQATESFNNKLGEWIKDRPVLLFIAAVCSVSGCCYFSQVLARYSKTCNIELNKYYLKRRFEKQRTMQTTIVDMLRSEITEAGRKVCRRTLLFL